MKTCNHCHRVLPELFFHADHRRPDELACACRACESIRKIASKKRLAFVTGRKRNLQNTAFELFPLQGLEP